MKRDDEIARLRAEIARKDEALRMVDKFFSTGRETPQPGGEWDYRFGWINFPEKPEKTPERVVRAALSAPKGKDHEA